MGSQPEDRRPLWQQSNILHGHCIVVIYLLHMFMGSRPCYPAASDPLDNVGDGDPETDSGGL